jgi:hypothetical protein
MVIIRYFELRADLPNAIDGGTGTVNAKSQYLLSSANNLGLPLPCSNLGHHTLGLGITCTILGVLEETGVYSVS